ncbi:MAG: histidine kinase [Actinomycetota bacterium]|nr:MAG: histidine kinase [Actinomycetota bacterium]
MAAGEDLLAAATRAVAEALAGLPPRDHSGEAVDPRATVDPGEAAGVDEDATLGFVFVSGGESPVAAATLAHVAGLLPGVTVVGCTADGVIGGGAAVESAPAVAVWLARLPGCRLRSFHLEVMRSAESISVLGMPSRHDDDVVAILLADPWSFPVDGFVARSADSLDGLPLVGGLASGSLGRGQSRLIVDGVIHDRGAVGVVLSGPVAVHSLVSQGCRPIGPAMTVTAAEGPAILELAGAPAVQRAREAVATLPAEEQALAVRGLRLGLAMDEYAGHHGHGTFLVRGLLGVEGQPTAISAGEPVAVGRTVRFHLRDAEAAEVDLDAILQAFRQRPGGSDVAGALLFSCNGRGRAMFDRSDHDVRAVRRGLGAGPVAGFFAGGEIGPVGGRNHVHAFTASVLVFDAAAGSGRHDEVGRPETGDPDDIDADIDAALRELTDD